MGAPEPAPSQWGVPRMSRSASMSTASSVDSPAGELDSNASYGGRDDEREGSQDLSVEALEAIKALSIMRSGSRDGSNHHQHSYSGPGGAHQRNPSRSASGSTTNSTTSSAWDHSNLTTSSSTTSSSPAGPSSLATDSELGDVDVLVESDPNFIARVSQLPLVSGGIEWYERSKASSRVVKYGAGLVESSFSTISRPITNNLQLGAIDDFACRQLDRLGAPGGGGGPSPVESGPRVGDSPKQRKKVLTGSSEEDQDAQEEARGRSDSIRGNGQAVSLLRDANGGAERGASPAPNNQQAVAVGGRSRWQTVLMEAGGLGAAVSEESLKSLRYCLQWLLYATAHLDHQISVLRDFIVSLHRHPNSHLPSDALVTASASAHLTQIKHDVVETIRKVVEVVSKYAGVALPEQAKRYVRQSILSLPMKWASAIEGSRGARGASVGTTSSASTPTGERMEGTSYFAGAPAQNGSTAAASTSASTSAAAAVASSSSEPALRPTEDAAERVLTFAVESLDMLKSVTQIFGESVEKAEAWIERLRVVGLDRQRQRQASHAESSSPPSMPDDHSATGMKRRRGVITGDEVTATGVEENGTDGDDGLVRRKRGPRSREATAMQA